MSTGVVVESTRRWPVGPEGGQALGGERGDQLAQPGHRPPAGRLDLLLAPAPCDPGRRPYEGHGQQVLAEAVVHGVEQPVPGQRAGPRAAPPPHEGPVQDLARCPAQQCPVEVGKTALGATVTQPKAVRPPPPRGTRRGSGSAWVSGHGIRRRDEPGGRAIPSRDSSGVEGGGFQVPAVCCSFCRPLGNQSSSFSRYFISVILICNRARASTLVGGAGWN